MPCEMRFRRKSEASQRTRERTDLVDGVEPRRPAEEGPRREAGFARRRRVVEPICDCVLSPASTAIPIGRPDASERLAVKP